MPILHRYPMRVRNAGDACNLFHSLALVWFFLLANASATGAIIYVIQSPASPQSDGQSWLTAFSTLQSGIAMAKPGDEVWVAVGAYRGPFVLNEGVALYGGFAGNETVRSQRNWMTYKSELRGAIPDDAGGEVQAISLRLGVNDEKLVVVPPNVTSATRIDGFTIRDARASFGGGIYSGGGSPVLANNTIVQNTATGILGGGGIFCDTARELALQTPSTFFTNVASHLFQAESPALRFDQIQIHPTNQYTAEVHRLLQLAANIYDATHGTQFAPANPDLPTVYRPVYGRQGAAIFISGFVEERTSDFLNLPWYDISVPAQRAQINGNVNVYGMPIIIGAKKGYPNFNEFALQTAAQITRRVELRKRNATDLTPFQTNQMYVVGISNSFGIEAWNSYTNIFARPLELRVTNFFSLTLSNSTTGQLIPQSVTVGRSLNLPPVSWQGGDFKILLQTNLVALSNAAYVVKPSPHFVPYTTNIVFEVDNGFYTPQWTLLITNRMQYILIDSFSGRVVDFVNLTNLSTGIDLGSQLIGNQGRGGASEDAQFWSTDLLAGVPRGIRNQIRASQGELAADWTSFNFQPAQGQDKQIAIKLFREFTGLDPSTNLLTFGTSMQAPYMPARKLYQNASWQANDPLVHYTLEELTDLQRTNNIQFVKPPNISPINTNLGKLNDRYNPWGGNTNKTASSDPRAYNLAIKDPLIRRSDDWDFPAERVVNLRWLDRVHRGTPWQTIYFGSRTVTTPDWQNWSGSAATQSTNDWRLIARFIEGNLGLETSVNTDSNPAIVNNTIAANYADGGGAGVYISPDVAPVFVNNIVAMNSSGIFKTGFGTPELRYNCVFGNTAYDYGGLSAGARDISVDPKFVSLQSDNFDLLATSPCLDTGDDSVISFWLWADEGARKFGSHIDIGAYELSPQASPVLVLPIIDSLTGETKLELIGFDGQRYQVEASTNFFDWQPLETKLTIGGSFELIDLEATNFNHRFYRAVKAP